MSRQHKAKPKAARPKTTLCRPDLVHSKRAVLDSLRSPGSKRRYRHAIDQFIHWNCSEPRFSFSKIVVTRYRISLEDRRLTPGTINGRLGSRCRTPQPGACRWHPTGQRCKKVGRWLLNRLTAEQARRLWQASSAVTLKGKRNRAIIAILLGCGLWRRELADSDFSRLQQGEEHSAIVDSVGKGGHIRTVPMPNWVKTTVDLWTVAVAISSGKLFRCVCRAGKCWDGRVTERVLWHVVKQYAKKIEMAKLDAS